MINVRNGTENDKQKLLYDYPNLHKFFGDNGYLIVAEKEKDIIGFLWAFNVYLEAMEEAENKGGKPEEIGYARLAGLPQQKHSQRLLGYCRKRYITSYHNKRKTCTQGIL